VHLHLLRRFATILKDEYKIQPGADVLPHKSSFTIMSFNIDQFTDKAQQTLQAAITLAKDYANGQLHPAHLAFVLLNEGAAPDGAPQSASQAPLFVSVINKAGGDPVRFHPIASWPFHILTTSLIDARQTRCAEAHRPLTCAISST
jgi:hypothetical protein